MSHTNITIKSTVEGNLLERELTKALRERDYWKDIANHHYDELENIPRALKEYGQVDFYDEKGNWTISAKALEVEK